MNIFGTIPDGETVVAILHKIILKQDIGASGRKTSL
jgi:hypothetical protein